MPNFFYTAKSPDGKTKAGTKEATNVRDLAKVLSEEGLILTKAEENLGKGKGDFVIFSSGKVSIAEKMLMTRNLWIMIVTGLPLVKGFSILAAQSKNKRLKTALLDIGQEVSRGANLSDSLKKYPDIFSELYRSMIQVGEESGTLEDVLNILALQLEREKEMSNKVQRALIYPAILVIVMLLVAICLSIFVLPKINTFFNSLNTDLPIITKIILGSGDFFMKYWYLILTGILVLITIFSAMVKTSQGRKSLDGLFLKIPLISSLVKKSNSASLIRSLSSLLSSGVSLIKSLDIASGTVKNFYYKQALKKVSKEVEKGKKLFIAFQPYQEIFPYGMIEMIEIGEETGRTAMILKKLAEFYEQEVSNAAESLSTIIEPILIVIIGLGVGTFAVSIIGPMYAVLGNIG
jgi:type IV pilus assembly protein PilC